MSEIKALEWHIPSWSINLNRAMSIIGAYAVWTHAEANGRWFWRLEGSIATDGECGSEDEAKAAAQSDYEARIRSAIIERKAEPVAWRYRYDDEDKWTVREKMPRWYKPFMRDVVIEPLFSTPPAAPVRVDAEALERLTRFSRGRPKVYEGQPFDCDKLIKADVRHVLSALSASPSPVDSRELIERLVKALEPFAKLGDDGWGSACPSERVLAVWWADDDKDPHKTKRPHITQGDIRNARRVLLASKEQQP